MGTVATLTKSGRAAIAATIAQRPIFLGWGTGEEGWDSMADPDLPQLQDCKKLFCEIGRRRASVVGFCEPVEDGGDSSDEIGDTGADGGTEGEGETGDEAAARASAAVTIQQDDGDIVVPTGTAADGSVETVRYRLKAEPTPYLYIRVNFDFGDAPNDVIREIGIFLNAEPKAGLPAGQMYFVPEEIEKPGELLAMQIVRPKILRSPSVRQILELVLPI